MSVPLSVPAFKEPQCDDDDNFVLCGQIGARANYNYYDYGQVRVHFIFNILLNKYLFY